MAKCPQWRQAMALRGKGAEMGPTGPRIDSKRRSGVGRYVRAPGWPFVDSGADPLTFYRRVDKWE